MASVDHASPYQSPASMPPPPIPPQAGLEPPAVKVFGIMHLVLAAIGLFTGAAAFFSHMLTALFVNPNDPNQAVQLRYQEEIRWVTWMSGVFALVLAGLLFVAGLKLVRSKKDGVLWSNRYAWTSIGTKVVILIVSVAFVLPAMQRMMGGVIGTTPGMPGRSGETFAAVMKAITAIATVAGPILYCLYPALALYFLSRPRVKEWAGRPSGA